ncbi:MAG: penicillin-insensitive murein endopeptidase [Myxococcota bacterium]|nr:penicillin-insensitive murein endopeptidase [Myxococcota bacterium]MDW8360955.1 penicillin-insensitive murein endopeptidase [Myxococcales bacterium]
MRIVRAAIAVWGLGGALALRVSSVCAQDTERPTPPLPLVDATSVLPDMPAAQVLGLDGSVSTSLGGPSGGRLVGGVPLPDDAPGLVSNPRRPNARGHYGTVELVQALVRAAGVVERRMPGSALVVNDLSLPGGGPMPHHASHQSGRDADVLFYLLGRDGRPFPSKGIPLDPSGRGWDFGNLVDPRDDVPVRLDVRRTWRFVRALLEDRHTGEDVQRIFVVEHVRTLLLAEAERTQAPAALRERFEAVTCQPSTPHDDHLHIRFFCTPEDIRAGCADGGPMYPWQLARLRAAGVEPIPFRPLPRPRGTAASPGHRARAALPPMHWRVRRFLQERERWTRPPRTGRPYCR